MDGGIVAHIRRGGEARRSMCHPVVYLRPWASCAGDGAAGDYRGQVWDVQGPSVGDNSHPVFRRAVSSTRGPLHNG